jgi:hypothetical protein
LKIIHKTLPTMWASRGMLRHSWSACGSRASVYILEKSLMNIMNPEQKEVIKNYFRKMQPSATGVEYQALYRLVNDDKLDYRAFKNACKKLARAITIE